MAGNPYKRLFLQEIKKAAGTRPPVSVSKDPSKTKTRQKELNVGGALLGGLFGPVGLGIAWASGGLTRNKMKAGGGVNSKNRLSDREQDTINKMHQLGQWFKKAAGACAGHPARCTRRTGLEPALEGLVIS